MEIHAVEDDPTQQQEQQQQQQQRRRQRQQQQQQQQQLDEGLYRPYGGLAGKHLEAANPRNIGASLTLLHIFTYPIQTLQSRILCARYLSPVVVPVFRDYPGDAAAAAAAAAGSSAAAAAATAAAAAAAAENSSGVPVVVYDAEGVVGLFRGFVPSCLHRLSRDTLHFLFLRYCYKETVFLTRFFFRIVGRSYTYVRWRLLGPPKDSSSSSSNSSSSSSSSSNEEVKAIGSLYEVTEGNEEEEEFPSSLKELQQQQQQQQLVLHQHQQQQQQQLVLPLQQPSLADCVAEELLPPILLKALTILGTAAAPLAQLSVIQRCQSKAEGLCRYEPWFTLLAAMPWKPLMLQFGICCFFLAISGAALASTQHRLAAIEREEEEEDEDL
ncbi:hypothetical protein, conserved [Eimeria maxima]|uniref:Uncharacterized protein n=1 Tax=Eimeria maxima TaxID=5804 RepID=U6LVT8_EIMMA|nr:hypothetical protein, conserved [Eimeria maxima]CDJ56032.1 hypothetical protein, conserved [Eimeria maxima]